MKARNLLPQSKHKSVYFRKFLTVLALFLLLSNSSTLWADIQFVQTNGPQGGYSTSITTISDSGVGYAIVGGYVYKTANSGDSWTRTSLIPTRYLSVVKCDNSGNVFVGQSSGGDLTEPGIYKSGDGGNTWNTVLSLHNATVHDIIVDSNGYLYASVWGGNEVDHPQGIYKSTDSGETWNRIGLQGINTLNLGIDNNNSIYALAGGQLYKSTDNGSSWNLTTFDSNNGVCNSLMVDINGAIFVGVDHYVYRSLDGGHSWSINAVGTGFPYINAFVKDENGFLYVATFNGVYKSIDQGTTWSLINSGLDFKRSDSLSFKNSGIVYVTTYGGIYRTSNGGTSWVSSNNGIIGTSIGALNIDKNGVIFAGHYWGGIFKSTDGGNSWSRTSFSTDLSNTALITDSNAYIYVATSNGIYRSTDGGNSWALKNQLVANHFAVDGAGAIYFSSGASGLFKSTDNGDTWASTGLNADVHDLTTDENGVLYVGSGAGLYKSTDGGSTWIKLSSLFTKVVAANTNGFLYIWTSAGLYKSSDNGNTWIFQTLFNFGDAVNDIIIDSHNFVYISKYGYTYQNYSGVFMSEDGGVSWTSANTQPTKTLIIDQDGIIYTGGSNSGVYKGLYTPSPLTITIPSLSPGIVGSAYNQTLIAIGGTSPYIWAVSLGNLPPGLNLNNSSGVISGTPTTSGNYTFTVQVTDAVSGTATKQLSIGISQVDTTPPTTTASLSGGTYSSAQSVTLNCNDGAGSGCQTIYYCMGSGCNPTTVYTGAISIASSTVLRFYSKDNADNSESTKTETYTINIVSDTTPPITTASPSGGTYDSARNVTLSCNDGSGSGCQTTRYCMGNGCTPSTTYTEAINISSTNTLRFYSSDNFNNNESVKTEVYTINPFSQNVRVDLSNSIYIIFSQVSDLCNSSSSIIGNSYGSAPSGYNFVGNFYDITTCADYADHNATIDVTIPYTQSSVPSGKEGTLRMFHWENGAWHDVTLSVDAGNNTITGRVNSLSPFGMGYSTASSSSVSARSHGTGANENMIAFAILAILAGVFVLRRKRRWN